MDNYPGAFNSFSAAEKCAIDNRINALILALHWAEQAIDTDTIYTVLHWLYPEVAKQDFLKPIAYNLIGYCTACGRILPVPEIRCGCPSCGATGDRLYRPLYSALAASGLVPLLGKETLNFYISNAVYRRISWELQLN